MVRVYCEESDLERIERYCKKDVVSVAQLVLKFRGEQLLEEDEVVLV